MSKHQQVPNIPRVISPSPTPSETSGKDGYFPPTTRSKAARSSTPVDPIDENEAVDELDPELARARSRSRSPHVERAPTRMAMTPLNGGISTSTKATIANATRPNRRKNGEPSNVAVPNDTSKGASDSKGLLSPSSAYPQGFGSAYWRNLSRSPSPLGLIPIHREWREFVHKHEVPRKLLHVSIGFVTLWLYREGVQTSQIHPVLMGLLVPILSVDLLRFRWPAFNRVYIRILGPFMRESEAHDRFNGVISYLAGLWATMYFCRKDVAVMSVLLLSWCDSAASTFGRLWGKYTPRVRKGKSLAGSLAAFTLGVASSVLFWGLVAPAAPEGLSVGSNSFAYDGILTLPSALREPLGLSEPQATISGNVALGVISVVAGLVASVSEAIDLWGLDDNLTIPVLCGIGLGAFTWAFGGR
ncbi:related to HSD1 ER membrane protein [Ramularia collo-cygni]|uniref:Related to HSD1 ER membrane protein n=1 Tax=Ramularia collo-cygni TaxID=112498 RepID=A0A2D3V6L9_9PEZI|nr:related to HSD1 ER membrane protein [Ramularia collo-cygni]CZT21080.1 related to HSD1 ER membrane protein [Ramularia collo-cygni]